MPKALPVVVTALLLVLALVAPATVGGVGSLDSSATASVPDQGVSANTSHVLRLEEIEAAGFQQPTVVVLDAAEIEETDLDTRFNVESVQRRLDDAPNSSARRAVLESYIEDAAVDVEALQSAERRARFAYIEGDITAREYAQRLAIIHARADALKRVLGSTTHPEPNLWSLSSSHPSIQDRVNFLREELQYLTGPIRDEMAASIRGDRHPVRVFVAVDQNGFELSYIRPDDTYVRSAYRADNADQDASSPWNYDDILSRTTDLYPWALDENRSGVGSTLAATPVPVHGSIRTSIDHPHGRLVAHIDQTTEQVYYEIQYKRIRATDPDVETLPVDYRFNQTENGTRVLVSETYPGGPLQIRVLDVSGENATGYTSVPVTVNGTTQDTDFTGTTWFVSPYGTYNISTTANQTTFEFNVTVN